MKELLTRIQQGAFICLRGDLGAGKTTFVKKLAKAIGINTFKVKSPTYNYIRKYKISETQNLYHIDLYRLEQIDENLWQEIEEHSEESNSIIAVEWPERMENYLPEERIEISIEYKGKDDREISIEYLYN